MYKTYWKYYKRQHDLIADGLIDKKDDLKGDLAIARKQPKARKLKELANKFMSSESLSEDEKLTLQLLVREKIKKIRKELPVLERWPGLLGQAEAIYK